MCIMFSRVGLKLEPSKFMVLQRIKHDSEDSGALKHSGHKC